MIKTLAALLLLAASLPPFAQGADSVQSWTSSDGKIIRAEFIRVEGEAVVIDKDGKPFTIPFTKLAPASVELAKRLQRNPTDEASTTAQVAKKSDRAMIFEKLRQIIVPKIEFTNTPVKEAIDFLHQRSVELDTLESDPGRKGVSFVFNKSTAPDKIDALRIIDYRIRNVPLSIALKYVCYQTKLVSIVEDSQVTLIPQAEYETAIQIHTFTVPPDFLVRLAAGSGGGAERSPSKPLIQYLGTFGVAFSEGASATLSGNQLQVSNTRKELDKIEQLVGGLAAEAASNSILQFRWLQTDPQTADAIVDLIKANKLAADAFGAKIDDLVKGRKITEVAAFDRKIISGARFVLRPADDKLPLVMEAEAMVSQDGFLMDLRCVPEWTPMTTRGSGLLRSNTATTLSREHWQLFARWGDAKTDTLLLACGGANSTKPAEPQAKWSIGGTPIMVHLDAEWRECSAADLDKVTQAPPESRAKALLWLRGRSKLLASASSNGRSGQKSTHEHLWGGKSDAELKAKLNKRVNRADKELPPRPGVTFVWERTLMASDKPLPTLSLSAPIEENVSKANEYILSQELSLRLHATYVPLEARSKSQQVDFEFQGTLQAGVPELVTAKSAPQQSQPVVLVITPWYEFIR